jgi:putative membrane protein
MTESVTDPTGVKRGDTERRRLHPLAPLLRGARMLALAVAAISWQGLAQLGFGRWLVVTAIILVIAVVLSVVSWFVTGFHIVGRELRIYEGLIWRRTRAIPLERAQAIEVVRPLLARLAGLAELRIEVIGASKTEARLAYLTVEDAVRLRERLLELSRGGEPAADTTGQEPPRETPVHAVDNRHVLIANLLTPPTLFLPFGLAAVIVQIWSAGADWSLIGVASTCTAVLGVFVQPMRRVLADWNFTISVDDAGLRLQHGLLDTRSQTVPPRRVQSVEIVMPLLWRPLGWVRVRLDVAGYGGHAGDQNMRSGTLLPVADRATARAVIAQVMDGVDVEALPLRPVPRRARWVSPLAYRKRGFGYTDQVVAARDGWLTVRLAVAKLARVQSVRVVQGLLQRQLRLADLHVDTAGRLHVAGRDRDVDEAYALAGALAEASRAARVTEREGDRRSLAAPSPSVT